MNTADLPKLTAKQTKFVECVLKGMTQADAYRDAYDAEKMSDNVIWKEASILAADRKVSVWLDYAKQAAAERMARTHEGYLKLFWDTLSRMARNLRSMVWCVGG